jgi:catechol 2,3-dioxygenase-like lactoylglutathione lyase family enzyme
MTAIKGIAEIVLNCWDQAATRRFYEEVFGLEFLGKPSEPGPVFLQAGPGQAGIPQMIVLVPLPPGGDSFGAPRTLHHLAFEVSPEDFDNLETHLREQGFEIRSGRHPVIPSRTMYVDDPEGNEVEIICRA